MKPVKLKRYLGVSTGGFRGKSVIVLSNRVRKLILHQVDARVARRIDFITRPVYESLEISITMRSIKEELKKGLRRRHPGYDWREIVAGNIDIWVLLEGESDKIVWEGVSGKMVVAYDEIHAPVYIPVQEKVLVDLSALIRMEEQSSV